MFIISRLIIVGLCLGFSVLAISRSSILRKRLCYVIASGTALILMIVLSFLPFENLFFTFDSPAEAYKYYNPRGSDVELVISGNECDFIVDAQKEANTVSIIPKTKKGWKISTGLDTRRKKHIISNDVVVTVYQYKNTNEYFITIFNTDGGSATICDDYNTKFYSLERNADWLSKTFITHYAYIPDMGSSYTVKVNGKEIEVALE